MIEVSIQDVNPKYIEVDYRVSTVEFVFCKIAPDYYSVYKKISTGSSPQELKERKFIGIYHHIEGNDWYDCQEHMLLEKDIHVSEIDYFKYKNIKGTKVIGYNAYSPNESSVIAVYYNNVKGNTIVKIYSHLPEQYLLKEDAASV